MCRRNWHSDQRHYVETVIGVLQRCKIVTTKWGSMSHIDQSLDDDRCDCRHVRAMLPSMATLVALGRTCEDEYRQEYQHIASCSACQAEYNDVCSMTAEIYADDVPVVSDDIRAIRSRATLSSYSFWFSQALLTALNQRNKQHHRPGGYCRRPIFWKRWRMYLLYCCCSLYELWLYWFFDELWFPYWFHYPFKLQAFGTEVNKQSNG